MAEVGEVRVIPQITLKKKHNVRLTVERVRVNSTIQNNGNCSIIFYNQGDCTAWLMGAIKILPMQSHEMNFEKDEEIDTPFRLTFDNDGTDKDIAVTKIYKE